MAGDSARDFARRQREKAARLERSADMWERGADGEAATAAALDGLAKQSWVVFHDVRWPGRQRANIDHVAVGPGGVFVIDSKNWSGDVRIVEDVLLHAGRRREREVAAAAEAALAVTRLLQGLPATPVLCFVRPEPIEGWARDVMVCSTGNLAARLAGQSPVLGPESIRRVTTILQWQLTSAAHPTPGRSPKRAQQQAQAPLRLDQMPPPQLPKPPRRSVLPRVAAFGCGTLLALFALGVVIAIVESVVRGLPAGVNHSGSAGSNSSTVPVLGDVIRVDGSTTHPDVQLRADKVKRVGYEGPAYGLQEGRHLVAVHYVVRNDGTKMWGAGPPYLRFSALASDGEPAQQNGYGALPAARKLPAAFNLGAGKARQGFVVFSVADGTKLVRLDVDLGYGSDDQAEWLIP